VGGTAVEGWPAPAGNARRAGARRHGVLVPGVSRVAGTDFEFEFLQNFEQNSAKL
jgi:hypothetical protein